MTLDKIQIGDYHSVVFHSFCGLIIFWIEHCFKISFFSLELYLTKIWALTDYYYVIIKRNMVNIIYNNFGPKES